MKQVSSFFLGMGALVMGLAVVALLVTGPAAAQAKFPDPNDPAAVWQYIAKDNPYTEWGSWPSDEFKGFLFSGTPHTKVVRIFVNDVGQRVATNFPGEMPANTIIVKENFTGESPDDPGKLDALTIMYKVPGFNEEGGDWFWAKFKPDGTAEAAGKLASCAGCHYGIPNNRDGVLRWGFGGEPAVTSAGSPEGQQAVAQVMQQMQQPKQLPQTGAGSTMGLNRMLGIVLLAAVGLVLLLTGLGLRKWST